MASKEQPHIDARLYTSGVMPVAQQRAIGRELRCYVCHELLGKTTCVIDGRYPVCGKECAGKTWTLIDK